MSLRVANALLLLSVVACRADNAITPATPRLTIVSGDGQVGEAGLKLSAPLVVHTSTADGAPMPHTQIDWTMSIGGGWLFWTPSVTDAAGNASVIWAVGESGSPQKVTAALAGHSLEVAFTAVATPAPSLVLPLQNRLVFMKDAGVVTTALDGSSLHRLSFERQATCPALSPDNRSIAYLASTTESFSWSLYLMRADGTGRIKLTEPGDYSSCPFWSSDGKQIAFEDRSNGGLSTSVWLFDSSGQLQAHFPISGQITGFSPMGDRLVYWRDHDSGTPSYGSDIYTISVTGSDNKMLSTGFRPTWARDTNLIAFECDPYDGALCVMAGDGSQFRKIISGSYVLRPVISPNGALIAYTCSGGAGVCIVTSDGSPVTTVKDVLPADWVFYRWSPDSRMLAYECVYVIGGSVFVSQRIDLCTVNADGTGFRNLTNDESAEEYASFALP